MAPKRPEVIDRHTQVGRPTSILARIGLTAEEVTALERQGFVSAESRGRKCTVYKLRFRIGGRQRVRYVGTDPVLADAAREALHCLQKGRLTERELRSLTSEANRLLRESKSRLLPFAEAAGYRFHGRALRQTRRPRLQKSGAGKI